jgi:hypothetical protein
MGAQPDLIRAALLSPDLLDQYHALEKTLLDPRLNPWDGDAVSVRGARWDVVKRTRPGAVAGLGVVPHQITYRHDGVVRTVPLLQWRKLTKQAKFVQRGAKHLKMRVFPPMPMHEIKALSIKLSQKGVDPRKDVGATTQAIQGLLKARRKNMLAARRGSKACPAHGSAARQIARLAPTRSEDEARQERYPMVVGRYEWPPGAGNEWVWIEQPMGVTLAGPKRKDGWYNVVVHEDKHDADPDGIHHWTFFDPVAALEAAIALVRQSDGELVKELRTG